MINHKFELPRETAEEAKRRDDAFIEKYKAGTIPEVLVPPLDPSSDPFGRNFSWLTGPRSPSELAFNSLCMLTPSELAQACGPELRRVALSGSLASGSDEAVLEKWAKENFVAFCHASGEEGEELLELLTTPGHLALNVVEAVTRLLDSYPPFEQLSLEQRTAAAIVAIRALRPKSDTEPSTQD